MSLLNSMTVVTGVLRYDDLGYLALVHDQSGDEPAPTLFLEWDDGTLRRPSLDAAAGAVTGV